ncbi:thioredoxin-like protein [Entophlyctis helioformis]|nr:thioredoxin-like protein [Entophlyctis helioformis]
MISIGARNFAKFSMRATPKHTVRAMCGGASVHSSATRKAFVASGMLNASSSSASSSSSAAAHGMAGFTLRSTSSLLSMLPPLPRQVSGTAATAPATTAAAATAMQTRSSSSSAGSGKGAAVGAPREFSPGMTIEAGDDLDAILGDSRGIPVIVDFYADWCGPCRVLAPILKKAVEEDGKAVLVKVNVDEAQQIAQRFEIASLPTVAAFRNGVLLDSFLGSRDPTFVKNFVAKVSASGRTPE